MVGTCQRITNWPLRRIVARPAASVGGGSAVATPILQVSSASLTWGQRPDFVVEVDGSPTLQMQISSDNATFSDISGATGATPTVPRLAPGTYYYRCRASNGSSEAFSDSVTITVTNLGAKILYLAQSGDVISSQITDRSGQGNHATAVNAATLSASVSAINNKPAYIFDGTNDRYSISPAVGLFNNKSQGYIFAVCQGSSSVAGSLIYFSTITSGGGTVRLSLNTTPTLYRMTGRRLDADASVSVSATTAHAASWQVLHAEANWGTSEGYVRQAGATEGSNTNWLTDGSTSATNSAGVSLGGAANNTSFWNGGVAVVAVFDSIPTAQQKTELDLWAAEEYGLNVTPPQYNTSTTLTYPSSIDSITDLKARLHYVANDNSTKPLVVLMHGWTQQVSDFDSAVGPRWLAAGCNCLMVEMRGRGAAGGTQDGGGREIYDIIDAVRYAATSGPVLVNLAKVHIIGYSGGGGNALSCAARFPDFFGLVVSFFGIADYGFDTTDGWWYTNTERRTLLTSWIGDRPTYPERYKARANVLGIANLLGRLRLYHDQQDGSVPVVNTNRIAAAFTGEVSSITNTGDSPRWLHNLPNTGEPVIQAESTIASEITSGTYDAVPTTASRTYAICGWVETSEFAVWLGDGNSDFGSVTYTSGTKPAFTISRDYGSAIFVQWKGLAVGESMTVTINGVDYTSTAGSNGRAVFTP